MTRTLVFFITVSFIGFEIRIRIVRLRRSVNSDATKVQPQAAARWNQAFPRSIRHSTKPNSSDALAITWAAMSTDVPQGITNRKMKTAPNAPVRMAKGSSDFNFSVPGVSAAFSATTFLPVIAVSVSPQNTAAI